MKTRKRIKIAFLTLNDPRDIGSWSGINYYMAKALQEHCGEVSLLGPIKSKWDFWGKGAAKTLRLLSNKNFLNAQSFFFAKRYGKIAGRRISGESFDIIFSVSSAPASAFLQTTTPIVHVADITFALMNNYYPDFSNLLKKSIREAHKIASLAIERASLLLYSSTWAAQSAIDDYQADKDKTYAIPFGANLNFIPEKNSILIQDKSARCRLLFIGKEWDRKGGDIAFRTLLKLQELGTLSELTICGCKPPSQFVHKDVKVIPYFNKYDEKETTQLFQNSDFLLLPTRADCTPMVFAEANAFGIPAISSDVGGIGSLIENGVNGYMLPLSADGTDYANLIASIYNDTKLFKTMRIASRQVFDERLNWRVWAKSVENLIQQII